MDLGGSVTGYTTSAVTTTLLGNAPQFVIMNSMASGTFNDSVARLNGYNSILGRGLALVSTSTSEVLGQCVIGINQIETASTVQVSDFALQQSTCFLQPTTYGNANISGWVEFSQVATGGINARVMISGLPPSSAHQWHIHVKGNIMSGDGQSETGHLLYPCVNQMCRPTSVLEEAAQISNGSLLMSDVNGFVAQTYYDYLLGLYGNASITARAMVIHGNGTATSGVSIRMAHCVVGVDADVKTYFYNTTTGGSSSGSTPSSSPGVSGAIIFAGVIGVFAVFGLTVYFFNRRKNEQKGPNGSGLNEKLIGGKEPAEMSATASKSAV